MPENHLQVKNGRPPKKYIFRAHLSVFGRGTSPDLLGPGRRLPRRKCGENISFELKNNGRSERVEINVFVGCAW